MVRLVSTIALSFAISLSAVSAWTTVPSFTLRRSMHNSVKSSTSLPMALDYNDPVVAEEFGKIQPMSYEEVEEELMMSGVRGSPDMNEMDLKLMLVELRLMLSGRMPGKNSSAKKKPDTYSSKFEEALWEKPKFKEIYDALKAKGDHNSQNVAAEYLNQPDVARLRYGKDYGSLLSDIDAALIAVKEVTSPTLTFKGFPANMGEAGCRMTLEALGEIEDFECSESDDFPILVGKVTYGDIESAKKAIDQYNGMDMGMGQSLELESV